MIFVANKQNIINWLVAKGYSGNADEMMIKYLRSLVGNAPGSLNDLLFLQMQSIGLTTKGCLGDMVNEFFLQKYGAIDRKTAQNLFFTDNSQTFTLAAGPVATKFVILDPTDGHIGDNIVVTVQAQDADSQVVTSYQSDVTLVADGSATGDGLVDIVNGEGTKTLTDAVAETVNLSLTDSETTGLNVDSTQNVVFAQGGIDANTVLMLHCDGTDASTTFTDSSASGHTVTANGDAQIDTAQKKFGTASGLFDGTGDYLTIADHADFTFGANPFTIDFWYRPNVNGADSFYSQYTGTTSYIHLFRESADNKLYFYVVTASVDTAQYTLAWTPTPGTWVHVALVRNGTSLKIFLNGVSQTLTTLTAIGTSAIPDLTDAVTIGKDGHFNSYYIDGWLDEYRVSKGIARWTADFTPPAAPYSA